MYNSISSLLGSLFRTAGISAVVFLLSVSSGFGQQGKKVVIGYVGGYGGEINHEVIDASKLTHINYAFVDVKGNRAWLHNEKTDTINFRKLNLLKKENPSLKILISLGGWSWSENFSDAVLSDTSRAAFAASAVEIIARHKLDGVDIDWEYPAMPGEEGNIYRPEDKENFTLMFKVLREKLDSLQNLTGDRYLLTTAVGGSASFVRNTNMDEAHQYLDYVNIMSYDYMGGPKAMHHTNLHNSSKAPGHSTEASVDRFIAAGVPASKIVVGIAFYGRAYIVERRRRKGLNQQIVSTAKSGGYSFIKDSLINKDGYKLHWDRQAKAPFLFNRKKKQFITFDDERSVAYKCKFVNDRGLAGVMFWQYFSDPKSYLIHAISQHSTSTGN